MSTRSTHRIAGALVAGCCLAGGIATAVSGGASAQPASAPDATAEVREAVAPRSTGEGEPSMSSPYVAEVPHVPADVTLTIGPGGEARYIGPEGSIFNGPTAKVDARVEARWAEQMAAGVTPEEADERLRQLTR